MKILFSFLTLFILSSCSSYVDQMHAQIDAEDQKNNSTPQRYEPFDRFRNSPSQYQSRRQIATNNGSSEVDERLNPRVRRQYVPEKVAKKRFKENDLNDNSGGGSLWSGQGNENFLFTKDRWKKMGDIVVINVMNKLKNDITLELIRAFPDPPPPKPEEKESEESNSKAPASVTPPPVNQEKEMVDGNNQIHDHISSVIIEEISRDHLLVRGQKQLLYKNRKRIVEVQALVSRKDITDEDKINSDSFLETNIVVMR